MGRSALFLVLVVCIPFFLCGYTPASHQRDETDAVVSYSGFTKIDTVKNHFVIVGDTQGTSYWEFWRERNNKEYGGGQVSTFNRIEF